MKTSKSRIRPNVRRHETQHWSTSPPGRMKHGLRPLPTLNPVPTLTSSWEAVPMICRKHHIVNRETSMHVGRCTQSLAHRIRSPAGRCVHETLRYWPAVNAGTFRELMHDDYVTGVDGEKVLVPSGTQLQIQHWTIHRAEKFWGPTAGLFLRNSQPFLLCAATAVLTCAAAAFLICAAAAAH